METGIINGIQRYNLHDGPGIRTLVFLQGCPLRCLWCANPDTQSPQPFDIRRPEKCLRCGLCARVGADAAHAACPSGAIERIGKVMSARAVLLAVMRDLPFYAGRGGATLSGGEPLMQWRFAGEILELCRVEGVHTAVETCGYAPEAHLIYLAERADLILYDLKHIDPAEHLRLTGADNAPILRNLPLAARRTRVIARLPIIGGVNDRPQTARQTARFLRKSGVAQCELLPYHTYGVFKYALIGRSYALDAFTPDAGALEALSRIYRDEGVAAEVLTH